jgi:hypothetical protein
MIKYDQVIVDHSDVHVLKSTQILYISWQYFKCRLQVTSIYTEIINTILSSPIVIDKD